MSVLQIPIFPSKSFDATAAFYGHLEFAESARHGDEYLIMSHTAGLEVHFFASDVKPRTNNHGAYVRFDSLSELPSFERLVSDFIGCLGVGLPADFCCLARFACRLAFRCSNSA